MQTLPLVIGAVLLAGGTAAFVQLRSVQEQSATADADAADAQAKQFAALTHTLDRVAMRMESLEQRVAGIENAPIVSREPAMPVDEPGAKSAAKGAIAASGDATGAEAAKTDRRELDSLMQKLLDPLSSRADIEALWKEITEKGMLDDALAQLNARIEADPNNAELQLDLAQGYLNKLFGSKNPMEQGGWAEKMDACYDRALEIDPKHWDARFSKAISYSFWPAITGKPAESVKLFETLRAQQEASGERKPEYAETYLLLGNMYRQQGKLAEAKQIYEKGAALFPDHANLKGQLGSL